MALHSYTSFDTNITISNNFINGSGGIYFYSQSGAMTSNINILNNKLENIYYYGIYTYYTRVGIIKTIKFIKTLWLLYGEVVGLWIICLLFIGSY